jgi:uncharacterized membrane protein
MTEPHKICQNIIKFLLPVIFLTVTFFSLYLAPALTWNAMVFAAFKGIIATFFAWLFYLIVLDAIIKSIMSSFSGMSEKRREGGLIYHFIKAADNEIIEKSSDQKPPMKKTGNK